VREQARREERHGISIEALEPRILLSADPLLLGIADTLQKDQNSIDGAPSAVTAGDLDVAPGDETAAANHAVTNGAEQGPNDLGDEWVDDAVGADEWSDWQLDSVSENGAVGDPTFAPVDDSTQRMTDAIESAAEVDAAAEPRGEMTGAPRDVAPEMVSTETPEATSSSADLETGSGDASTAADAVNAGSVAPTVDGPETGLNDDDKKDSLKSDSAPLASETTSMKVAAEATQFAVDASTTIARVDQSTAQEGESNTPRPQELPDDSLARGPPVDDATKITTGSLNSTTIDDSTATAPEGDAGDAEGALGDAELSSLVDEAFSRLAALTGADLSDTIGVQIANLSGDLLARYEGGTLLINGDAAGLGWFVDLSPSEDNEFGDGSQRPRRAAPSSRPDRIRGSDRRVVGRRCPNRTKGDPDRG
jgi:hypothetical protein